MHVGSLDGQGSGNLIVGLIAIVPLYGTIQSGPIAGSVALSK